MCHSMLHGLACDCDILTILVSNGKIVIKESLLSIIYGSLHGNGENNTKLAILSYYIPALDYYRFMTYFGVVSFFGTSKSYASIPTETPHICKIWWFDGQLHLQFSSELILRWYDIFFHVKYVEFEISWQFYCFCNLFLIVSFFGYSLNV